MLGILLRATKVEGDRRRLALEELFYLAGRESFVRSVRTDPERFAKQHRRIVGEDRADDFDLLG